MAGNEQKIAKYLILNKGKLTLHHLGTIHSVGAPQKSEGDYVEMKTVKDIKRYLSTEDSRKKADIYINGHGISVKQKGASFAYNRWQRANLVEIFELLKFKNATAILKRLDREIRDFHEGNLERRNRPWSDFFTESEFKAVVKFLMIEGSPNVGFSTHPAKFILEGPAASISAGNINVYTFEGYFKEHLAKLKIAIRRQWIGQASDSEHKRAKGLAKKPGNAAWVFDNVSGLPNIHKSGARWRKDVPAKDRKTIYFLMIEKET